ncbi:MAG: ATP-binding cassette domain-containing protein [Desulfobulbaceae bacterium]|nr:MAG: ATP-binding cassette domain-containing protein [Desulfobulbaceae bacterium]
MDNTIETPIVKRTLFSWVRTSSLPLQLLLLGIIVVLVFLRVLPLEMQKRIINDVLAQKNINLLIYYCLIYLSAVLGASLLKFLINWLQTLIGQKAMTDMRRQLYSHILRLPLSVFRTVQTGSVSASLITELAPSASFVGMAVAVPVMNVLTLLAFAAYLFWLNPLLAVITLSIYPIALFVIPLVQKGVNRANKERVDGTRRVADQITESVSGVNEVHAHGSFLTEERKYNRLVDHLFRVRVRWTLYRYGVKVLNNLFVSLGPVIVFILGGYLMIIGEIELGAIVAFLSAQEKLFDPWKELIDFYQVYQDASIRYKKSMQMFDYEPEFELTGKFAQADPFSGAIAVKDLEFSPSENVILLDKVSLEIEAGEHLALVGFSGSGKSTLAKCIGQLYPYTGGEVLIDEAPVAVLPKEQIVKTVGFISQSPFIYTGTINDNLLYTWRALGDYLGPDEQTPEPDLDDKIEVLQQTGLFVDVLRFGLNSVLPEGQRDGFAQKILNLRKSFQQNFSNELSEYVEFYHEDRYLYHSPIGENLVFGSPLKSEFDYHNLYKNPGFLGFLERSGLRFPLVETGAEIIRQTVDILGDVPDDELFFTNTPIRSFEYEECKRIGSSLEQSSAIELPEGDIGRLIEISLRFVPAVHKIMALQPLLEQMILSGRSTFKKWCQDHNPDGVTFYDSQKYISSQSVLNNIFFGNLAMNSQAIEERVNQCIVFLLIEEDLLESVARIGMDFHVGNNGDRLSGGQQQKLAIARVFLKKPTILIMDEATSALDNKSQARIQGVVEKWRGQRTVISVIHRLDLLSSFDKVAVMKAGKIVEWGTPAELKKQKGLLYELIHGKKH